MKAKITIAILIADAEIILINLILGGLYRTVGGGLGTFFCILVFILSIVGEIRFTIKNLKIINGKSEEKFPQCFTRNLIAELLSKLKQQLS